MSKRQSDRKENIQSAGQRDRVTERQNDNMADSRAAKQPALVPYRGNYSTLFFMAMFRHNLLQVNIYKLLSKMIDNLTYYAVFFTQMWHGLKLI